MVGYHLRRAIGALFFVGDDAALEKLVAIRKAHPDLAKPIDSASYQIRRRSAGSA